MSETLIQARNLSKVYRLYAKPHYRALDMLGLLRNKAGAFTEHAALDRINVSIGKREKVAIIGRNGAGKSTFLKLVTNVIRPTSGEIRVKGEVHALLQIGTGFHPDFTGRENVYSYLAHLGVTGQEADRQFRDIVDFAELEDYIDQPVKTYSTGMGVRLMFSTSTAISPDVLILDEVLGVGDAYFAKKSFERMRELCEAEDTSLLLVTHDVYSALLLCERFIWIEQGRVYMDGPGQEVVHAYEASIRDQEERRLRSRRVAMLQENRTASQTANPMYGQIRCSSGQPPPMEIPLSHLRFLRDGQELLTLQMDAGETSNGSGLVLDEGEGNWGAMTEWSGRGARMFALHGSIYHRLPFVITSQDVVEAAEAGCLEVELGCGGNTPQDLDVLLFHADGTRQFTGQVRCLGDNDWADLRTAVREEQTHPTHSSAANGTVRYGQRALEITDVQFMDGHGQEKLQFDVGSAMRVRLAYRINDPDFCESPTIIIAFQKDGVVRSHRFWTDQIRLAADDGRQGTLEVSADPVLLGRGTYTVTVSVFQEGYLTSQGPKQFFTANDKLYDMHSRAYEVVVKESLAHPLCNDVVFQHPCVWSHNGTQTVMSKALGESARECLS